MGPGPRVWPQLWGVPWGPQLVPSQAGEGACVGEVPAVVSDKKAAEVEKTEMNNKKGRFTLYWNTLLNIFIFF